MSPPPLQPPSSLPASLSSEEESNNAWLHQRWSFYECLEICIVNVSRDLLAGLVPRVCSPLSIIALMMTSYLRRDVDSCSLFGRYLREKSLVNVPPLREWEAPLGHRVSLKWKYASRGCPPLKTFGQRATGRPLGWCGTAKSNSVENSIIIVFRR